MDRDGKRGRGGGETKLVKREDWREGRAASSWFLVVASKESTTASHIMYRIVLFSTATEAYAVQFMVILNRHFSSGQGADRRVPTVERSTYSTVAVLGLVLATPLGQRHDAQYRAAGMEVHSEWREKV